MSKIFRLLTSLVVFFTCYFIVASSAQAGTIIKSPAYLGLTRGLVGCWTFDGAYTKVPDCSGNNNVGTITSATKDNGKVGQALDFNGTDSQVNMGSPTIANNLTAMSISAWIKPRADGGGNGRILQKGTWGFMVSDTGLTKALTFFHETDGTEVKVSANDNSWATDRWTHVMLTTTGSLTATQTKIYVNGAEVSYQVQQNGSGNFSTDVGTNLLIGADNNQTRFFNGLLDDVRIYNRTLSASEIGRLYRVGVGSTVNRSQSSNLNTNGLIGCWNFDGTYTKVPDCSGNNNTGTLIGGPAKVKGKIGQALDFDGEDDYVSINDSPIFDISASDKYTWAFWLKPDDFDEWNTVWHQGSSDVIHFAISPHTTSDLTFGPVTNGITAIYASNVAPDELNVHTINNVLTVGSWYHVVITYDGSLTQTNRFSIYVNGADVTDRSDVSSSGTLGAISPTSIYIGYSGGAAGENEDGLIDDFRYYNRILSASEIRNLYQETQSKINDTKTDSLTNGLMGYWTFDGTDVSGTRAKDVSGQNNHGTLLGTTKVKGKVGQALNFNGSTDQVQIGAPAPLANFQAKTISAWIYPRTLGENSFGNVFSSDFGNNTAAFYIQMCNNDGGECSTRTNTFVFYNRDSGGGNNEWAAPANTIKLNTWQHIAITFVCSDTDALMYYNGVRISTLKTISGGTSCLDDTTYLKYIGANADNQTSGFDGLIDDVRIYNRALSASEINKIYQMGR